MILIWEKKEYVGFDNDILYHRRVIRRDDGLSVQVWEQGEWKEVNPMDYTYTPILKAALLNLEEFKPVTLHEELEKLLKERIEKYKPQFDTKLRQLNFLMQDLIKLSNESGLPFEIKYPDRFDGGLAYIPDSFTTFESIFKKAKIFLPVLEKTDGYHGLISF
jgi:hypothetical protein